MIAEVLKNIKLVCSDVDGTLVEEGKANLNPEYYEEILRLKEKGIMFAAVSGRTYDSVHKLFEPVLNDILFICDNGAVTIYQGRVLKSHFIAPELVREIAAEIEDIPGCSAYISAMRRGYVSDHDRELCRALEEDYALDIMELKHMPEDMPEDDVMSIALYHPTNAEGVCSQGFYTKWHNHKEVDAFCSGRLWMNVCRRNVDKGTALREVMEEYGFHPDQVMAFGDNMNDLGMLKSVTNSVAVGSARQEVKDASRFVCDTQPNHGVLQILKQL